MSRRHHKSSGWDQELTHPDAFGIKWHYLIRTEGNIVSHQDDIPFHLMSFGWLNWGCYLIRMSYGNIIMSSWWHTLPFLSHPDEIANFDFSQHVVALQRFRTNQVHGVPGLSPTAKYFTTWTLLMQTIPPRTIPSRTFTHPDITHTVSTSNSRLTSFRSICHCVADILMLTVYTQDTSITIKRMHSKNKSNHFTPSNYTKGMGILFDSDHTNQIDIVINGWIRINVKQISID